MLRNILICQIFILLFAGCKELEDFKPYENKNLKAPTIYNMDAIGLTQGSNVGSCIYNHDIIELYEFNVNSDFSFAEEAMVEFVVDGVFQQRSTVNTGQYNFCQYAFGDNVEEGIYELVIKVVPNYEYNSVFKDNLSSYLGFNENGIIFKQILNYKIEPLAKVNITRAEIIEDTAFIEWDFTNGTEPQVYRFYDTDGCDLYQQDNCFQEVLFGSQNSYQFEWDKTKKTLGMEYSNRSDYDFLNIEFN